MRNLVFSITLPVLFVISFLILFQLEVSSGEVKTLNDSFDLDNPLKCLPDNVGYKFGVDNPIALNTIYISAEEKQHLQVYETYTGHCGGCVTDGDGDRLCCDCDERPICDDDGDCWCSSRDSAYCRSTNC